MRKYQQTLLLFVTILVIIAFAWLYNDYGAQGREDAVGKIYDRPVRLGEYHRGAKRMQVAQELGMFDLIGGLAGDARTMEEVQPNFVFGTTYFVTRPTKWA